MAGTPDRMVETLARLNQYDHNRDTVAREGGQAPITIALSRQAGARGAEIARLAGQRLGWPVYDHELLECIAKEKGLHTRLLELVDERYVGWLEEAVNQFTMQKSGYLEGLQELLVALSKRGHSVIVGRGAAQRAAAGHDPARAGDRLARARVARVQSSQGMSAADAERLGGPDRPGTAALRRPLLPRRCRQSARLRSGAQRGTARNRRLRRPDGPGGQGDAGACSNAAGVGVGVNAKHFFPGFPWDSTRGFIASPTRGSRGPEHCKVIKPRVESHGNPGRRDCPNGFASAAWFSRSWRPNAVRPANSLSVQRTSTGTSSYRANPR